MTDMPDEIWVQGNKIVDPMEVGTCVKYTRADHKSLQGDLKEAVERIREAQNKAERFGELCYIRGKIETLIHHATTAQEIDLCLTECKEILKYKKQSDTTRMVINDAETAIAKYREGKK